MKTGSVINKKNRPSIIGWREWAELPDLGVPRIKVKVDTGARTSALHALDPQIITKEGLQYVRFRILPLQHKIKPEIQCEAPLVDSRMVVNSGGKQEYRFVILTRLLLGEREMNVEVTLTDRALLGFRMLVGRTAIRKKFLVDPARSFLLSGSKTEGK
ncbi:MAG: ATP-dependent zinc protease [Magnetococcales bacterium]|nr:ATP-dependent zinc protease [Magnetococcales bacterium]